MFTQNQSPTANRSDKFRQQYIEKWEGTLRYGWIERGRVEKEINNIGGISQDDKLNAMRRITGLSGLPDDADQIILRASSAAVVLAETRLLAVIRAEQAKKRQQS